MLDFDKWKPHNYEKLSPFKKLGYLKMWAYLKEHENDARIINVTLWEDEDE